MCIEKVASRVVISSIYNIVDFAFCRDSCKGQKQQWQNSKSKSSLATQDNASY